MYFLRMEKEAFRPKIFFQAQNSKKSKKKNFDSEKWD